MVIFRRICYDKVYGITHIGIGRSPGRKEVMDLPSQVTNYQCPACTGPLKYDPQSGKLVCEYCESVYDPKEIETLYAQKEAEAEAAIQKGLDDYKAMLSKAQVECL